MTIGTSPKRILLIEDDPADARLMRELLRDGHPGPFECREAGRLSEGLSALTDADLVLLDLNLPDAHGLSGYRSVRAAAPRLPIVVVTGLNDQELALQATAEGAQDYLVKGRFDADTLGRVVRIAEERERLRCAVKDLSEQLRQNQLRLQQIIESNADGMLVLDPSGTVRFANGAALALFGLKVGELVGATFRRIAPGWDEELAIRTPTGEPRSVELRTVKFDWDGVPAFLTSVRDVTRRHWAEKALRESEERYRLLFAENPQPLWVVDRETGRFLEVNAAAVERYGYDRGAFLDLDLKRIQAGGKDFLSAPRKAAPCRHRTRDGTILDVEVTSEFISLRDRSAVLMQVNDVTQRLKLETELRQTQKMDAIGRLVGGIAHDFNNMLMAISGYVTMAKRKIQASADPLPDLEHVEASAERAASLVRQLLAFGRRQVLQPTVIDLNATLHDLQPMLRRLIPEDIQLTTGTELEEGRVRADRAQIEQVIMNLVLNARDAMPHGGELTVTLRRAGLEEIRSVRSSGEGPSDYLVLSVVDTGVGIPEEARSHIFEPFFTTKPQGQGTGLGLPTVFGIVKQSGGEIAFETTVGKGTAFRVYLPETSLALGMSRSGERPAVDAQPPRTMTILLVEDENELRAIMRETLESSGYRVIQAENGEEAIRKFEAASVDILVTDLTMPKTGGCELARVLRERAPALKVLFMSGYSTEAIAAEGAPVDSNSAFLEKPVSLSRLIESIQSLLGKSAAVDSL